MHPLAPLRRPPARLAFSGLLLAAALLVSSACVAQPPAEPTPVPEDAFAAVRATSEAAYRSGVVMLDQGDLERALVTLNQARVNDPDDRADIRGALDEAIRRVRALPATPTRTPIPTRTPLPAETPTSATPTPAPSPGGGGARPAAPGGFAVWRDSQGRFSVAAPGDWQVRSGPTVEFGRGIVAFRDPSGKAEVSVAIDPESTAPSPELYSARMDLTMQRAMCTQWKDDSCVRSDYVLDNLVPGITASRPSLRRNFSTMRRDVAGRETLSRGFQVAVLRGSTPYLVAGMAPAPDYPRFEATFNQIIDSFSFG